MRTVTGPSGSQSTIVRVGEDFEYELTAQRANKYFQLGGVRIASLATSYAAPTASLPPAVWRLWRRIAARERRRCERRLRQRHVLGCYSRPVQRDSLFSQLARLGLANLVPLAVWRRDRPWTIASVQWFLFFTLFPLFLVAWTQLAGSGFSDVAYLYSIYFAMIWGLVLWLFVRPEKISLLDVARVSLFTSVTGVFLVGVLYRLPFIAPLVTAARDPELLRRVPGNVLGVGLLEELVKAIPVLWIFVRNKERGTLREILYLGCVSGFAFGVTEAVAYSVFYAQNVARGGIPLGAYVVLQLTRFITLPLLHAVFSGIAAQFIALGVHTPALARALGVAGIAIAALIHGLYNTFSGSPIGFAIAVAAVLVFIAYVRSIESMRLAVEAAAKRA